MKDQLKKRPVLLLFLVVCLLISIPVVSVCYPGTKGAIVSRVKNNEAQLTEVASSVIERGSAQGASVSGVQEIIYSPEREMVEFLCGGFGLAPSSSYTGFYYSPSDVPLNLQYPDEALTKTDTGWRYEEAKGDNQYKTEKITDHWYYYWMCF
ncbi:hypothetical protein [Faecalispora jeddahensis]|uniref:hypothetical protein n=1 Tax=Faecalispora jeddahensis TaxID=1414721 RepID=UPI00145AA090|nr:hypothetical protein [Faecalispora jeddahensis]